MTPDPDRLARWRALAAAGDQDAAAALALLAERDRLLLEAAHLTRQRDEWAGELLVERGELRLKLKELEGRSCGSK